MTAFDYFIGLSVFALAATCGYFAIERFDLWFAAVAREDVARVAGKAMFGLTVVLVVAVALSWCRIEVGMVPAVHGDLNELRQLLLPCAGLLVAVVATLFIGDRVLGRAQASN